jgi:hypothetical protein
MFLYLSLFVVHDNDDANDDADNNNNDDNNNDDNNNDDNNNNDDGTHNRPLDTLTSSTNTPHD